MKKREETEKAAEDKYFKALLYFRNKYRIKGFRDLFHLFTLNKSPVIWLSVIGNTSYIEQKRQG